MSACMWPGQRFDTFHHILGLPAQESNCKTHKSKRETMSPLPGVSQRANQRLFKAETVQCPFYHATCLESICVCLKCVWKTEWLVHNRWQIVWCCKSVYNYYVYTICAEKVCFLLNWRLFWDCERVVTLWNQARMHSIGFLNPAKYSQGLIARESITSWTFVFIFSMSFLQTFEMTVFTSW